MPIRTDLSKDREPVEVLAEDFIARQRAGEHPTIEEYIEAYPNYADDIAAIFPAVLTLHHVDPHVSDLKSNADSHGTEPADVECEHKFIGEFRILREIGRGGMGVVYEAEQLSLGRRVALKLLPGRTASPDDRKARFAREARAVAKLHHTNIVPIYNVGSEGDLLFYSMQFIRGDSLDNVISVLRDGIDGGNIPPSGDSPSAENVDGKASRSLEGKNRGGALSFEATGIFGSSGVARSLCEPLGLRRQPGDFGLAGAGDPLRNTSSIQMVDTKTIEAPNRRQVSDFFLNAARVGAEAADAIQYAHSQGILHRDIKPGNLLVDETGRVWLTDFGLARLDEEQQLTESGDIIGTLRYMAPEVFSGINDARNDVYSLGLTLYELVCLKPAFDETERPVLLRRVMAGDTPSLKKQRPDVPADLVTIIEKSIATNPAARYQSAGELRDDLRRFLEDQPILARQMSVVERLSRWKRREPRLATAIAAAVLATIVGVFGISYNWLDAAKARDDERRQKDFAVAAQIDEQKQRVKAEKAKLAEMKARRDAENARDEQARLREAAEIRSYNAQMALAQLSWEKDDISRAISLLEAAKPKPGQKDRRQWEWYYLNRLCHSELWSARGHSGTEHVLTMDISRDGKTIATGGGGNLYFNNPEQEKLPGEVILREFETGKEIGRLEGHRNQVSHVAFHPDGNGIVSIDFDGDAKLWDLKTQMETATLSSEFGPYEVAEFSPDGLRLMAVTTTHKVFIFDLSRLAEPKILESGSAAIEAATFSPDGSQIVTIDGADGGNNFGATSRPVIWAAESGKKLAELDRPLSYSVEAAPGYNVIRWTPDGERIVAGLGGGTIAIWSVKSGKCDRSIRFPNIKAITSLECSNDGRRCVCAGETTTVHVVDLISGEVVSEQKGHTSHVVHAVFGPNDTRLASVEHNGELKVWDNTRAQAFATIENAPHPAQLEFSADSRKLHTLTLHSIHQYDVKTLTHSRDDESQRHVHVSRLDVKYPRADSVVCPEGGWAGMPRNTWFDIVNLKDGKRLHRIHLKAERVTAAAIDQTNRLLALSTRTYHQFGDPVPETRLTGIRLYDAGTFELLRIVDMPPELQAADTGFRNCRFNSDGSLLAATINGLGDTSEVVIIDTSHGVIADRIVVTAVKAEDVVYSVQDVVPRLMEVEFHPTLPHIATLNMNTNELLSWSLVEDGHQPIRLTHRLNFQSTTIPGAHSMAYSPVGHRIAVANPHNKVQLLDARSGFDVIVLNSQKRRHNNASNPRVRFSPDGRKIACFKQEFAVALWNTDVETPEIRMDIVRRRSSDWHGKMSAPRGANHLFSDRFHLEQKLKNSAAGPERQAAKILGVGRSFFQARRMSQFAASFEDAFHVFPDWTLAAEAASFYLRVGDTQNGFRMAGEAVRSRFQPPSDRLIRRSIAHHFTIGREHEMMSTFLVAAIQSDNPDAFEVAMNKLLPNLDPSNPVHAAVAAMALYGKADLPRYDWNTAKTTIQQLGYYPGFRSNRMLSFPRGIYMNLLARLHLLDGQQEESIRLLDLVMKGDPVFEAEAEKRFSPSKNAHYHVIIDHEKIEARLLKVLALQQLGEQDAAASNYAIAKADWDALAEPNSRLMPKDEFHYSRMVLINSLLQRLGPGRN